MYESRIVNKNCTVLVTFNFMVNLRTIKSSHVIYILLNSMYKIIDTSWVKPQLVQSDYIEQIWITVLIHFVPWFHYLKK
jgi:hypothetical protein